MGKHPKCEDKETGFQRKKQEKSPEKELNEMKASKLPDTEFKAMVIRMLKELSEKFYSMKRT